MLFIVLYLAEVHSFSVPNLSFQPDFLSVFYFSTPASLPTSVQLNSHILFPRNTNTPLNTSHTAHPFFLSENYCFLVQLFEKKRHQTTSKNSYAIKHFYKTFLVFESLNLVSWHSKTISTS